MNNNGVTLIVTLIVLSILLTLGSSLLSIAINNNKMRDIYSDIIQSSYYSEGKLDEAIILSHKIINKSLVQAIKETTIANIFFDEDKNLFFKSRLLEILIKELPIYVEDINNYQLFNDDNIRIKIDNMYMVKDYIKFSIISYVHNKKDIICDISITLTKYMNLNNFFIKERKYRLINM